MNGKPTIRRVVRDPVLLLATGFGTGLVPRAPGTAGTLLGVALWIGVFERMPWIAQAAAVALAAVGGTWLCTVAMARLDSGHDDPVIVWDEVAGIWLALCLVPPGWVGWLTALVLFRVLDIAKPWPISWVDRLVPGGLGVMGDDLLAGLFAGVVTALALYGFGVM